MILGIKLGIKDKFVKFMGCEQISNHHHYK